MTSPKMREEGSARGRAHPIHRSCKWVNKRIHRGPGMGCPNWRAGGSGGGGRKGSENSPSPEAPAPEGLPPRPLQAPQSPAHPPGGGPGNSRATPAAGGAAAGRFYAGASCSRRGSLRGHFLRAPGPPPPSTCSETRAAELEAPAEQRSPAHPESRFCSPTSHPPQAFRNRTFQTSGEWPSAAAQFSQQVFNCPRAGGGIW